MRLLVVLVPLLLVIPACGRKDKATPPQSTNTVAQSSDALQPSKAGLTRLSTDTNPYIRNNAKAALESWEAKDYTATAIAMQKIISLCQSDAQRTDAMTSLAQLKMEVDEAAAKGNSNAKEAAAQLQQIMR